MRDELTTRLRKLADELDTAVEPVTGAEARTGTWSSTVNAAPTRRLVVLVAAAAAAVVVVIGLATLFRQQDDAAEIGPATTTSTTVSTSTTATTDFGDVGFASADVVANAAAIAVWFDGAGGETTFVDFDGNPVGSLERFIPSTASFRRAIEVNDLTAPLSARYTDTGEDLPLAATGPTSDECLPMFPSVSGAIVGCPAEIRSIQIDDGTSRRNLLSPPEGSAVVADGVGWNSYVFLDLSPDGRHLLAEWLNLSSTDDLTVPFTLRDPEPDCIARTISFVVDVVTGESTIIGAGDGDWTTATDYRAIGWTEDGRALVQRQDTRCPFLGASEDDDPVDDSSVFAYAVDTDELNRILEFRDTPPIDVMAVRLAPRPEGAGAPNPLDGLASNRLYQFDRAAAADVDATAAEGLIEYGDDTFFIISDLTENVLALERPTGFTTERALLPRGSATIIRSEGEDGVVPAVLFTCTNGFTVSIGWYDETEPRVGAMVELTVVILDDLDCGITEPAIS